jgi:oxygen-independent coproporphyrinogen III oxidase
MTSLAQTLYANPYQGYAYSYPHKTAYRMFEPPLFLKDVWATEDKSSLFLYLHIPFCEMRCGFCNLFTMANPEQDLVGSYLDALERQAIVVRAALGNASFAQMAVGGGTPSFLEVDELQRLFSIITNRMGATPKNIPVSFEVSPKTVTLDKLQLLKENGVDRISIGIQSFIEEESKLLGRPQRNSEVENALGLIRDSQFDVFNIDLIYGGAGQTPSSWDQTLRRTMEYAPEEVFLYPLYVRPLTGLDKMGLSWDNFRLQLYRQGRDFLLEHGYTQVSMRMFRKKNSRSNNGVAYCCQEDGMVGLGSGARSYTADVHYSSEYAVGRKGVKSIIRDFTGQSDYDFSQVHYGVTLTPDEKKRRYVIKSLLHGEGLVLKRFRGLYSADPITEYSQIRQLIDAGFALISDDVLRLTADGMELSDSIGPALYSDSVISLMEQYSLR